MTGYCAKCGNTLCICAQVELDEQVAALGQVIFRKFETPRSLRPANAHQSTPGRVTLNISKG